LFPGDDGSILVHLSTKEAHGMFARVTVHEGGDTERLRKMNDERRAAGTMGLPEGVRRVMLLAGARRRVFITFFDSREAIAAAEARFETMGDEIPEEIRGKRVSVDVYEVMHEEQLS
jgi:hypothetical protein